VIGGDKVGAYLNIGGGRENSHELFSEEAVLTLNRWQHLAMTYDGQDLCVYLNGTVVGSQTIGKPRVPGTTPLSIGKRQDNYVALTGRIDEVLLYNRALSPAEIRARFEANGEPPTDNASVVGQWSFEEHSADAEIAQKALEQAGLEPAYRRRLLGDDTAQ
jgi:hypothetical protein